MNRRRSLFVAALVSFFGYNAALATELRFVTEPLHPFVTESAVTGQVVGPVAEILQAVCDRIHASCSLEVFPWRRAYIMAERGEVDGIIPFFHTVEREKNFYISDMGIESAFSFFTLNASNLKYSQPRDLDGYTVGVYGPSGISSTVETLLKSGSTGKADIAISNVTVLRMLAGGRYGTADTAVAVLNRDVGLHLLKTEGIQGIKWAGDLQKINYGIGLSRKKVKEEQFHRFNDALRALMLEGKIKMILDRYGLKSTG